MKLLPIIALTIFAFASSNPVNKNEDDYRLELPSRSGRRISSEHEPTSLLRKSREIDFKNALFSSLDESGVDTSTYKTSSDKRNKLSKRKRGRKGKGKKGRKGRKGKKKGKSKKRRNRKNRKDRKNRKNRKNKSGRRKKNRIPKRKKPRKVEDSQFFNNLYNYAINAPNEHDSSSFDEQKKDAQTRKYWMRQSRRSLNGGSSKSKDEDEDSYDSDILDDYAEIDNMPREIRASTSIDDLFDSKYDMNCLAWDPLTGRCINSRRSGCFGDSSDDGGLMGC